MNTSNFYKILFLGLIVSFTSSCKAQELEKQTEKTSEYQSNIEAYYSSNVPSKVELEYAKNPFIRI